MTVEAIPSPAPGDLPLMVALRYALRGWPVFPVHSIRDGACTCQKPEPCSAGKHPRTLNGVQDATTDTGAIARWWGKWPDANVGIATGMVSNLLVLDVDPEHGGDDSLDALIDEHGHLPETVVALSGGGGTHFYFDYTGVEPISNSAGKLGPGLDIRSDGGYVVAPPSCHISGDTYEWELSSHPDDTPLAAPPQWLVDALTGRGHAPSALNPTTRADTGIDPAGILKGLPEGERNYGVFRFASRHRGLGLAFEETMVLCLAAAREADPPLPQSEVVNIISNVYKRYEAGPSRSGPTSELDLPQFSGEPLHIVWGNEIENLPSPEWIIDGIIPSGAFVVLYGAAGTGKSFTALDMAAAISSGQPWHGHETQQGPVIDIAAEGVGDLGIRHQATRIGRGIDDLPDIGYILEPVNLFIQADVRHLIDVLDGRRPALIIADTLARSMDGGDENVVKDMNVVIRNVDYLRNTTGAAVMPIHHTGHDKSRERGSSALKGAADVFIKLGGGVRTVVTLRCDKMKMAKPFDDVTLRFEPTGDSLAVVSHVVTPVLDGHEQSSLMLVSGNPLSHKAWLRAFEQAGHGSKSTFNRALKALRNKEFVGGSAGESGDEYVITEAGQAALGLTGVKEVSDAK